MNPSSSFAWQQGETCNTRSPPPPGSETAAAPTTVGPTLGLDGRTDGRTDRGARWWMAEAPCVIGGEGEGDPRLMHGGGHRKTYYYYSIGVDPRWDGANKGEVLEAIVLEPYLNILSEYCF